MVPVSCLEKGVLATELREIFSQCSRALLAVGAFSGLINLLALTGSIYMLQVYDRVLPSHSIPTLVGLSIIVVVLYAGFGVLDAIRSRMMGRLGVRLDRGLRDRLFSIVLLLPLRVRQGDGLQPVRDLDTIRGFLSSPGPIALFDLPWLPFYLGLVYLLHPWLGVLGAAGAFVLVAITMLTELRSRAPARNSASSASERHTFAEAARRNAEAVRALGMASRVGHRWRTLSDKHLAGQLLASDVTASYGAISKSLRMILQSAILGLGAYLVVHGEATAGVMIAASILISRALAPVEIAIANWRGFISARQSVERISNLLNLMPARDQTMDLPKPHAQLQVEGLCVAAPGEKRPVLQNVSFSLQAGAGLGIIGPSASGKSTLVRTLVGAWLPQQGAVRLDDAILEQRRPDALGRFIGYLPQDIELFGGTVAQNIARFDPDAEAGAIIAAAKQAGIHEMILRLADGYDTRIGEGGASLSAGQRQRVALARALYGEPFLVVLDEPNSHLDAEGDAALTAAILGVRNRGGIAIVVAHRPSALSGVDQLLVLAQGQVQAFGPRDAMLRKVTTQAAGSLDNAAEQTARLRIISDTASSA